MMAWIYEYPGRSAAPARRMPGFGIAVGHLLSPNADPAVFSVRRFCVENLSNGAAPHASNNEAPVTGGKIACINGRKEPPLVSIPDFAKIFWSLRPGGRYFSSWR